MCVMKHVEEKHSWKAETLSNPCINQPHFKKQNLQKHTVQTFTSFTNSYDQIIGHYKDFTSETLQSSPWTRKTILKSKLSNSTNLCNSFA